MQSSIILYILSILLVEKLGCKLSVSKLSCQPLPMLPLLKFLSPSPNDEQIIRGLFNKELSQYVAVLHLLVGVICQQTNSPFCFQYISSGTYKYSQSITFLIRFHSAWENVIDNIQESLKPIINIQVTCSLRSSRFLSFAGEQRSRPGMTKKMGRSGEGLSENRRGWGLKESHAVNPKHFTELHSPTNGKQ